MALTRTRTTALLEKLESAGGPPLDRLLPLVYEELYKLAHRQLLAERTGRGRVSR